MIKALLQCRLHVHKCSVKIAERNPHIGLSCLWAKLTTNPYIGWVHEEANIATKQLYMIMLRSCNRSLL